MAEKILIVDDEPDLELLINQRFRKQIRDKIYEFEFAANGRIALEKLEQHPTIGLVMTDINMPEMDGLTLLEKMKAIQRPLRAVVVSAYGDMQNIRTAMNRGAFDFVTKPVDFNDFELTMEKTITHVNQVRETVKAIQENNILKMYVDENVLNFMTHKEFENNLA